jgi:hypothetical protein
MNTLRKYVAAVIAFQFALCLLIGLISYLFSPRADFLFEIVVYFYAPIIYVVSKLANFGGESNIFVPIIVGIPFGIVLYALAIGFILQYFLRK